MLKSIFNWLGIEAKARAITVLLAIGGMAGAIFYFVIDRVAPTISPSLSVSEYGAGYRSGKREAELKRRLEAAESALQSIQIRQQIEREVEQMTPLERRNELKKWVRD